MTSPIVHFDIAGPTDEPLHAFYHQVFGWTVDARGPGYALVQTPAGSPNGAITSAETAGVVLGVGVDDLAVVIEQAEGLGGSVVMPPTDNGWVNKAQIADPAGNVISLIENSPSA